MEQPFSPNQSKNMSPAIAEPIDLAPKKRTKLFLLLIYMSLTAVGTISGPLLQKLYFTHGGTLEWLQTLLVPIGFVAGIPLIFILYLKNRSVKNSTSDVSIMDLRLFISSGIIGLVLGLTHYMFSTALVYLPVSTSTLLAATNLAFTAVFAFLLVRQKFTFYSLNSVFLMTLGSVTLALNTSSDRPPGVSKGKYLFGFFMILGAAALSGLITPNVELAYKKNSKPITFFIVLQFQVVMNAFASLFAAVGMLIKNDFKIIPKEAREFGMGEAKYYVILVSTVIVWQLSTIGVMGVISCTSALFAGIFTSVLLPVTQVAAVIAFHDKYSGAKGLSLALSVWGLTSYFTGEYKKTRHPKPMVDPVNRVEDLRTTDLESLESRS